MMNADPVFQSPEIERYERVRAMRAAGLTFARISELTGMSQWTCRQVWKRRLEVVLDPDILLIYQARMLDRVDAQLDALRGSMGLRRNPRRPRLGFQQGGLTRTLHRPSGPPSQDRNASQPWKARKKQKTKRSRTLWFDYEMANQFGEVDQDEVGAGTSQLSSEWVDGRDEPDWTLGEDDIGLDPEIADGRPSLLVECERILAEQAEIKRQERRARARLSVGPYDDDDDDDD